MNEYLRRVSENILPLSNAEDVYTALKEWFFTESVNDFESAEETCELCNQEQLRYQFEIKNQFTNHCLWVGSSCILKFQLKVFEAGKILNPAGAKKKLNALQNEMRLQSCIKALSKLAEAEDNEILRNALAFYKTNKYLTPKYGFVVFWRLSENKIDHSPSFFKISLRRDKYKEDLREMRTDRVHLFWSALTSSQRDLAIELGHSAPSN